jgi:hypothetical protein
MKIDRIRELLDASGRFNYLNYFLNILFIIYIKSLNEKSLQWEGVFKKHQTSWKVFYVKTKHLEEWIINAQTIVSEVNEDLNYLIQKHKVSSWNFISWNIIVESKKKQLEINFFYRFGDVSRFLFFFFYSSLKTIKDHSFYL